MQAHIFQVGYWAEFTAHLINQTDLRRTFRLFARSVILITKYFSFITFLILNLPSVFHFGPNPNVMFSFFLNITFKLYIRKSTLEICVFMYNVRTYVRKETNCTYPSPTVLNLVD